MIFSVAYNGYDRLWRKCVESHRAYAQRMGYSYVLCGEGETTSLSMECAWLKIPLLIAAIDAGHPWILFVDADTMFAPDAPRFETVEQPGKDIYLSNGFSGRPNSGVMAVRSSPRVRELLLKILFNAGKPLPRRDRVGWGENGEVIHFLRDYAGFGLLDRKWNNNSDLELADHIRHFSSGAMRDSYDFGEEAEQIRSVIKSTVVTAANQPGSRPFFDGLSQLLDSADPQLFDTADVKARMAAFHPLSMRLPFVVRKALGYVARAMA